MHLTGVCNGLHHGNGDSLIRRRQDAALLGSRFRSGFSRLGFLVANGQPALFCLLPLAFRGMIGILHTPGPAGIGGSPHQKQHSRNERRNQKQLAGGNPPGVGFCRFRPLLDWHFLFRFFNEFTVDIAQADQQIFSVHTRIPSCSR